MNYYLPTLAEWRHGWVGEMVARASELAADGYNSVLGRVYQAQHVPVANVFSAFYTSDFVRCDRARVRLAAPQRGATASGPERAAPCAAPTSTPTRWVTA